MIEEGKRGCFSKIRSWLNDEGVQLAVRKWISGSGKCKYNVFFFFFLELQYYPHYDQKTSVIRCLPVATLGSFHQPVFITLLTCHAKSIVVG